jgi:Hint module
VFVVGRGAVRADTVAVGDLLTGSAGEPLVVTSVSQGYSRGLFAPFTFSGDIVVNGVLASNYVAFLGKSAIDHHSINHAYLAPIRMRCRLDPEYCASESYDEDGVSNLYTSTIRLVDRMNFLDGWSHFILSGIALPALLSLQAIENVAVNGAALV